MNNGTRYDITEMTEQITEEYRNGTTIKQLAEKYNTSYSTIRNRLLKNLSEKEYNEIKEKNRKPSLETQVKRSKSTNTSGYFRVSKYTNKGCRQGFQYVYSYYDKKMEKHRITRVNIKELEKTVKQKGLPWIEY